MLMFVAVLMKHVGRVNFAQQAAADASPANVARLGKVIVHFGAHWCNLGIQNVFKKY